MAIRRISAEETPLIPYLKRVLQYKSLIGSLAKRDIRAQYAQTLLGILWSALQPLAGLLVFTIFFDKLIQVEIPNKVPYPLFAFSGMISWYYFTFLIAHGGTALINSQSLIKKVYFPKLILPISKVVVGLLELGISMILLAIMMLYLGRMPSPQIIFLPLFIILNIITGLAVAIWLSALTVRYRDFQHLIPYLINFGIWLTPVFYPSTLFPPDMKYLIYLNPMAGVIEGFRWTLLGGEAPSIYYIFSFTFTIFVLGTGLFYFRRIEKSIADYV